MSSENQSAEVRIVEVGPRDGLQNESRHLSIEDRAELGRRLAASGVGQVELVSFASPAHVPQMAGAEEVPELVDADASTWAGLVLNERGLQRALATSIDVVNVVYPLSDEFCRRNQNMSLGEAAAMADRVIRSAREAGRRVIGTLAVAFGCPFEGPVSERVVIEHANRLAESGASEVVLADTIGVGLPRQVRALVPAVIGETGLPIGLHLRNTRNTGYVNALEGVRLGVSCLDASVGGIGGCPFAPRATGNIATEDLVHLLEGEGISTGVDISVLIDTAVWLTPILGKQLPGLVHRTV